VFFPNWYAVLKPVKKQNVPDSTVPGNQEDRAWKQRLRSAVDGAILLSGLGVCREPNKFKKGVD